MGTHSNSLWGPVSWKRRIFELHHLDNESTSSKSDPKTAAAAAAAEPTEAKAAAAAAATVGDAASDERLSLIYFDIDPILPELKTKIHALLVAEKSTRDVAPLRENRAALELEFSHRKAKSRKGEIILLKGATSFQVGVSARIASFVFIPVFVRSFACFTSEM